MRFGPRSWPSLLLTSAALSTLVVAVSAFNGAPVPPAAAAVAQSGVTTLTAPVVQPGSGPARSSAARLSGAVRFSPARKGRPVTIQRRVPGGSWSTSTKGRENGSGVVTFTGAAHSPAKVDYEYRGVARRWNGLAAVRATAEDAGVWTTQFKDEFSTFDTSLWADRTSNAESRSCAVVGDPRARSVSNGTLNLRVMLDPDHTGGCTSDSGRFKHYLNGQVSTQAFPHAYTHGIFAARIKFPRNRGEHGSFWLQPVEPQYLAGDPARSGAEIDIVEFFGKGYPDGGLASFVYNYGIDDGKKKIGGMAPKATAALPSGDTWWSRYHVFSLEWTKSSYVFRVDGRKYYRTSRGVSGVDQYLILSMLSSDWELAQAKKLGITPTGTMHVDWARVWQR